MKIPAFRLPVYLDAFGHLVPEDHVNNEIIQSYDKRSPDVEISEYIIHHTRQQKPVYDGSDQGAVGYGDAPGSELLPVIKLGKERSEAVSDILVADDVFK